MKQLQKGLAQLSEEGATQFFRPLMSNDLILGAVGVLQFDVVAYRLKDEYGVDAAFEKVGVVTARWVRPPRCKEARGISREERVEPCTRRRGRIGLSRSDARQPAADARTLADDRLRRNARARERAGHTVKENARREAGRFWNHVTAAQPSLKFPWNTRSFSGRALRLDLSMPPSKIVSRLLKITSERATECAF